jgi:hypothetical protein
VDERSVQAPCSHCLDTGWVIMEAETEDGEFEEYAVLCRKCSKGRFKSRGGFESDRYNWKGEDAATGSKNMRARRMFFEPGPCEVCGAKGERHHKDGDPGNNVRENIAMLCRRHHMEADGRLENSVSWRERTAKRCGPNQSRARTAAFRISRFVTAGAPPVPTSIVFTA